MGALGLQSLFRLKQCPTYRLMCSWLINLIRLKLRSNESQAIYNLHNPTLAYLHEKYGLVAWAAPRHLLFI
jgi:hypothetical protein